MGHIIIEVDEITDIAYNSFSGEKKKQLNLAIQILLKKTANLEFQTEYKNLLNKIGFESISNGLTSDILDELLKDNG